MPRKSVIFAERTERISVENVMRPIFLIGFMGSGKTTLAKALSRATGLEYIDLDAYIEARFHANVSEIFAREGQDLLAAMRRGEMDRPTAIARIAKNTRVYAKKQLTWLKRDPDVIWLRPDTAFADAVRMIDSK